MNPPALLLIAHGSREPSANSDLQHVADELIARHGFAIAVASYLELCPPDIDEGARKCVALGATHVVMVPYFLSAGVHVRRDLAAALERAKSMFPLVEWSLAEPLGRHPLLIDIVAERARGR